MALGKTFIVLATLFVIGLAYEESSDVPSDAVFDCLGTKSREAVLCYRNFTGTEDSYGGGALGRTLRKLLPKNYDNWHKLVPSERALKCTTALLNFIKPLEAVVQSENQTKFVCPSTGQTLNKTLHELLAVMRNSIFAIDRYVWQRYSFLTRLTRVPKPVNMTSMTSMTTQMFKVTGRKAIILRNYIIVDFVNRAVSRIATRDDSCFNTDVPILTLEGCSI